MKRKRIILLMTVTFMLFAFCGLSLADYVNEEPGSIQGVDITFRNCIESGLRNASAKTITSNGQVGTSVGATFYYLDEVTATTKTHYGYSGHYGTTTVTAPTLSGRDYYFKITSNHVANYMNMTLYTNNLTVYAP